MKIKFHLINISGWIVFAIAFVIYSITLEPTTSYWDCSEFILSAAKLEVNHPSGAPFFMILGRLFSLLSFGNPQKVAAAINLLSAFSSALTIMFLFWIIIRIAKNFSDSRILITGSAFIGSLSFAFTDSFWFSAMEGEVYALSIFFLTISIWSALKWELQSEQPESMRWIFFIALMAGLGIGVHLLNLLAFPAIALIIGIRKYGYSLKVLIISFISGSALIGITLSVLSPVVLNFIAFSDRIFVNNFNMPVHSGIFPAIACILLVIVFLLSYFRKHKKELSEAIVFSILLFLVGFSIYSVNVIRSNTNTPVNFGRPDNVYSLTNYLNREQYPQRPLIKGQNYNSPVIEANERYSWDIIEGKYHKINLSADVKYDKNSVTIFPRMYSNQEGHPEAYKRWINIKGKKVRTEEGILEVPTLNDQLKFFFKYQLGFMYVRYFMWNFSGRQNDIQARGDLLHGNWITGISFIDELHVGSQDNMPEWMKENKARNRYFMIPLLLGLTGAIHHFLNHRKSFFVVAAIFLMAGVGLVLYINEVPITPRERDYVFVGSFLAFCVWIGLSVFAISGWINKLIPNKPIVRYLSIAIAFLSPVLLITQNFDDHDRSDRFTARDLPANILKSCPPNAILFTNGDNDTYPLLYCQEVENIRTDVRIVIMPFLSANWFLNQLRNKKYDDEGLNMAIPQLKYDLGKLEYVPVVDRFEKEIKWKDGLEIIGSDNSSSKVRLSNGVFTDFLPGKQLNFEIAQNDKISTIPVRLGDLRILYKHELAFWDIVASNAATRPICFTSSTIPDKYGLLNYTKTESLVYCLTGDYKNEVGFMNLPNSNPEKSYHQLMDEFKWGNIDDENIYVDWNNVVNVGAYQIRNFFNQAALTFISNNRPKEAIELIIKCQKLFPGSKIPYDIFSVEQVHILNMAGDTDGSALLSVTLKDYFMENLEYFSSFKQSHQKLISNEIRQNLYYFNRIVEMNVNKKEYDLLKTEFDKYFMRFQKYLN
ncbi:MAG: DUF2723 domain-containing protein [Mariniphaga sp.]|nr:DUF2723 domain-containing protein [Mariniphaga sp.]